MKMNMRLDNSLFDDLLTQAHEQPRLRMNYDLRNSPQDGSQRMLNALLPGTEVPVHRHRTSSETVILLKGSITEILYDESGIECGRYDLDEQNPGIQIPKMTWHTLEVHVPSVIFEAKDGAFEPTEPEDLLTARLRTEDRK